MIKGIKKAPRSFASLTEAKEFIGECERAFENILHSLTTIKKKREMSDFCHSLPPLQRKALVSVCIATMCSDGRFTYEDLDFLEDCLL